MSSIKIPTYSLATSGLRWLAVGALFLVLSQSALADTNTPMPTGARRSIYPNEWGVGRPAGLAYAARFGQFFVLDKLRANPNTATIVTITPHEALVDRAQLDFAMGDALNMAFDEQGQRLLLLDRRLAALAAITLDAQGRLNPASLRVADLAPLRLTNVQGMAVDGAGQRLLFLEKAAQRVVSVPLTAALDFPAAAVTAIDLARIGNGALRGLAVHPTTGHLFIGAPAQQMLYEVTPRGEQVNAYTTEVLALNDPQAFVFAPSADLTDEPSTMHLFVADSYLPETAAAESEPEGQSGANRLYLPFITSQGDDEQSSPGNTVVGAAIQKGKGRLGEITEVALDWSPDPVTAAANPPIVLNLVQSVNTGAFSPPSPDPSGLLFIPPLNRLLISDGEVDEMPALFSGANLFETTLPGTVVRTGATLPYSSEPVGVGFNPANQHLFVADDDKREIFEVASGADGLYGTNDDSVTSFDTAVFNSLDPEGVTYDSDAGVLFIVDGINAEVYRVSPGNNGRFDGVVAAGGDDVVTNFDVQIVNIFDPEGIYYDAFSDHLFLVANNRSRIYEITTTGALVQLYDTTAANITKNADITLAPGSNNPGVMNFYIVDRGVDNDVDPTENDGKLHELSLPGNQPTPTNTPLPPTSTPTVAPSATATPLPPTATPTNTPLPPTVTPLPATTTPTNTAAPPTATPLLPTATPLPPTATPLPPTVTPTNTPLPPTSLCLAASQDTYLVQDSPTKNTGGESDLKVKPDAGKERRILIAFNLAAIPQGSTVLNATLRLYEDTKKDNQTIYLHRLTNSWSETQATWNNRIGSTRWNSAGGDFESTPLTTFLPNVDNRYRDLPVTAVTQSWVSGAIANYGLLLRSTGVNGEVKFKSRDESNTSKRPQLCITYQ